MSNKMQLIAGHGRVVFTDNPECAYKYCTKLKDDEGNDYFERKQFKNGSTAYYDEFSKNIYCKQCVTNGGAGLIHEEPFHCVTIKITKSKEPELDLEEETLRRGEHE